MSKSEIVNPDPFCAVRMEQIEHAGHKTDKYMITMQDPESDEFRAIPGVATVHGEDYQLVSNSTVRDLAVQVMQDTGMVFKAVPNFGQGHSQSIYWNGRRFSEKWYCEDTAMAVPGGSSMMLGLEVTNSYDGSAKVGLAFFAMHVACSNQFYSNCMLGRPFEFTHVNTTGEVHADLKNAMATVKTQAVNFAKLGPNMRALQQARIPTFEHFLKLRQTITSTTGMELRDKAFLDELSGKGITAELKMKDVKYEDPASYWSIANAYTAVTTHIIGGPRGSDYSQRVTDFLLTSALAGQTV